MLHFSLPRRYAKSPSPLADGGVESHPVQIQPGPAEELDDETLDDDVSSIASLALILAIPVGMNGNGDLEPIAFALETHL